MGKKLTVDLNDDDVARLEAAVAASDYNKQTEYVRDLIRQDADERGVEVPNTQSIIDENEDDEQSISDRYDPDDDSSFTGEYLGAECLREIVKETTGTVEINPDHVGTHKSDTPQGYREDVVEAMVRHTHDDVSRASIVEICKDHGLDTRYYIGDRANDKDIPGTVLERFGGEESDDTATVDDDKTVGAVVSAALAVNETLTLREYQTIRGRWDSLREDADLSDDAYAVISTALDDLIASTSIQQHHPYEEVDGDWPQIPVGLVERYSTGDTDVMSGNSTVVQVVREIADTIDKDVDLLIDGTTAGTWAEKNQNWIGNDGLPATALQDRAEEAREALEAKPDHPRADEVRAALDELEDEIEHRKDEECRLLD